MADTHETGILLVNLGTPDAPRAPEVRRYLREFLMDPRVLDINPLGRWALVNLIIAPFRAPKSAAAYREVWGDEGSPLLVHGKALAEGVRAKIDDAPVELAMRYGNPSIRSGLERLQAAGCERIVVLPLYPQYASSSTGSTVEKVYQEVARRWNTPFVSVVPPFYDHPVFIESFVQVSTPVLEDLQPDHVLFSYHGLPERHVTKSDLSGKHCLATPDCCERARLGQDGGAATSCYKAHCHATTMALVDRLGLEDGAWSMSFQSRLGRTPWLQPFTDVRLGELAKSGVERLAVFCPAFVADCLETLEEIGQRADEEFKQHGGKRLQLIPSLNSHPTWVDGVVQMIQETRGPDRARRALPVVGQGGLGHTGS